MNIIQSIFPQLIGILLPKAKPPTLNFRIMVLIVLKLKLVCKMFKHQTEIWFDHSYEWNLPIIYNAGQGNIDEVRRLLTDYRVNPCDRDCYVIYSATKNGHIEIVKMLLLDNRIDSMTCSQHIICTAVSNNHKNIVDLLVQNYHISVYDNSKTLSSTAIYYAVINNNSDILDYLLSYLNVDMNDLDCHHLLSLAIDMESYNMIKSLIKHPRINVNIDWNVLRNFVKTKNANFQEWFKMI
jgi:ankyrin repeat protein